MTRQQVRTRGAARRPRHGLAIAALLATTVSLVACGEAEDEEGVASIVEATAAAAGASASATADVEQELLDYTQCLRDQGLDVPDPEVDADGNVVLGGGGGPGGGDGALPDQEALAAATEVCGEAPTGLTSQLDQFESPEFQDALVAFTQCMRERGYDIADIDTSGGPPAGGAGGNPLGDLDVDDPAVAADLDECQSSAFAGVDVPLPGGNG